MNSICITTYNGEKYIKAQLDSILIQLNVDDEIIISDDGSTDQTLKIINEYDDKRIKLLNHRQTTKSVRFPFYKTTKNIENALVHAKGDLIFLVDQDDSWLSTKMQIVTEELDSSLCFLHDCIVVDQNGNELAPSYFDRNKSSLGIIPNLWKNSYLGCCMTIRKELLKTALPFPEIPVPHDIWLGLMAEWNGNTKMINNKLLYYRRHTSNQSTASGKSKLDYLYRIQYRLNICLAFIVRIGFKR